VNDEDDDVIDAALKQVSKLEHLINNQPAEQSRHPPSITSPDSSGMPYAST